MRLLLLALLPTAVFSFSCSVRQPSGFARRMHCDVCMILTQGPIPQKPQECTAFNSAGGCNAEDPTTRAPTAAAVQECNYETCPFKDTTKVYSVFQPLVDKFAAWQTDVVKTLNQLLVDSKKEAADTGLPDQYAKWNNPDDETNRLDLNRLQLDVQMSNMTTGEPRKIFKLDGGFHKHLQGGKGPDRNLLNDFKEFTTWPQNSYIQPYHAILVNLKDGQVQSVEWDPKMGLEGCIDCNDEPDRCFDYGNGKSVCGKSMRSFCKQNPDNCKLSVYLGWKGTDRNGRAMESSSMLFSNFWQFGLSNVILAATRVSSGVLEASRQLVDDQQANNVEDEQTNALIRDGGVQKTG